MLVIIRQFLTDSPPSFQTTSEGLLAFLDEAIRRARRDTLATTELLCAVRQNIVTSPYTTEEHVTQIDREVTELRARAISELNYDDPASRGVTATAITSNKVISACLTIHIASCSKSLAIKQRCLHFSATFLSSRPRSPATTTSPSVLWSKFKGFLF